jgi:hypothetical protein
VTSAAPQLPLDRLIARLSSLIAAATDALEADPSAVDDWHDEIARQIKRYTMAAYMSGTGSDTITSEARKLINGAIRVQLDFLSAFRDDIRASADWQPGWKARAQMYAESIKNPWWSGKTYGLPLPAMPGDGTTICLTRCGCAWEVQQLDGDGNYDAYWRRAKSDSCQTCVEREQQWSPLKIRDGELL